MFFSNSLAKLIIALGMKHRNCVGPREIVSHKIQW